jgi:N-acetylmuramoyl-L-alanine amidase
MNLRKQLLTNNECYKIGKKHTVKGIMVHSTGANNTNLSRYVGPDDGLLGPVSSNNWNQFRPDNRQVCVHAFIGKLNNGSIATYQTLPWDMVGWHSGSGSLGSSQNANNTGYIGFEICEDNLADKNYFNSVYKEAVELCAYLCKEYKLNPINNIICHSEGYTKGIASNHADVMHWFPKFGKSMNSFRNDVLEEMNKIKVNTNTKTDREKVQEYFGFDNNTMAFLDKHPYSQDFYRKLCKDYELSN